MRALFALITVCWAVTARAYSPIPVNKSIAEVELSTRLETAADSLKTVLAKEYLESNPEDIPVGRMAQDILLKTMEDPLTYFKTRMEQSGSVAAIYLYGRASRDSSVMAETAQKILQQSPNHFWGHELAGYAEWYRAKPATAVLIRAFNSAIVADPSRPEGYLYLGWVYWDEERWPEMRAALEAGAIADPTDKSIRDARLTVYAEQRDGKAFFDLMTGVFSDQPLTGDLPLCKGGEPFTSAEFIGAPTVLEYWAYT